MTKYINNGITFRSREEYDFSFWLADALEHKLIEEFQYEPFEVLICDSTDITMYKKMKRVDDKFTKYSLLQDWSYTPDFVVTMTDLGMQMLVNTLSDKIEDIVKYNNCRKPLVSVPHASVIVDTKGTYDKWHDSNVSFPHKVKALYHFHGIYVNKVIPVKFFKKTWVPEMAKYTLLGKLRMKGRSPMFDGYLSVEQFIGKTQQQKLPI